MEFVYTIDPDGKETDIDTKEKYNQLIGTQ